MTTTITIILAILVAINFLLLKFSSNKVVREKKSKKPLILRKKGKSIKTSQQLPPQLAATGS